MQAATLLTGAISRPNNALHNDDLPTPVDPKIPTRGVYPFISFILFSIACLIFSLLFKVDLSIFFIFNPL